MDSHDLARLLLNNEDLPVTTHANNHNFNSALYYTGDLRIGVMENEFTRNIIIGNIGGGQMGLETTVTILNNQKDK